MGAPTQPFYLVSFVVVALLLALAVALRLRRAPRDDPRGAAHLGRCCFCGESLGATPSRTLSVSVSDETLQPLACHDACLRRVVHPSIPLAIDAPGTAPLVVGAAWYRLAQRQPNELESALLRQFADEHPALLPHIGGLQVLSREFTGIGSLTRFEPAPEQPGERRETLAMAADLIVPACPARVLALLHCAGGRPQALESSTVDRWEGAYEGFAIAPRARVVAGAPPDAAVHGSMNGAAGRNGAGH
jgi:hypothetical protein